MKIEEKFNNGRLAYLCPRCRSIFATGMFIKEGKHECKCGRIINVKMVAESYYDGEFVDNDYSNID